MLNQSITLTTDVTDERRCSWKSQRVRRRVRWSSELVSSVALLLQRKSQRTSVCCQSSCVFTAWPSIVVWSMTRLDCVVHSQNIAVIKSKCLPVLIYGLEVYPIKIKPQMKLFQTSNMEIIKFAQQMFNFALPIVYWLKNALSVACCNGSILSLI